MSNRLLFAYGIVFCQPHQRDIYRDLCATTHDRVPVDGAAKLSLNKGAHNLGTESGSDFAFSEPNTVVANLDSE